MEKNIPEYCMKYLFIIVNALFVAKYSARIFPKGTIYIYNISLYRNNGLSLVEGYAMADKYVK
jgi:hypothetical protein